MATARSDKPGGLAVLVVIPMALAAFIVAALGSRPAGSDWKTSQLGRSTRAPRVGG